MGKQWKQWLTLLWRADGDCSHEIKRRLLLGRKVMTNLDSILISLTMEEAQAGIKIAERNINNLRYGDDTTYGRK